MSSKEYVYIKQSIFSITVFYFNYLFFYNSVADCQFLFAKVMDFKLPFQYFKIRNANVWIQMVFCTFIYQYFLKQ